MRIRVLSIFPELFEPFVATSLIGRARDSGLLDIGVIDLRAHTTDRHRSVDDEPYGGGGGMVMTAQPWMSAIRALERESAQPPHRVLMSPQGRRLDEDTVRRLASLPELILLCGRYEGIDERVRDTVVDEEISIGDYVLSGGELAAMVIIEAVSRQIPGVVGLTDSVENDSFRRGLLDYPHYTRPRMIEGREVPDVLLSGNHAAIDTWRRRAALDATLRKRPDLLDHTELDAADRRMLDELRTELCESSPRATHRPGLATSTSDPNN
ncbi:MAG: tRNA (guanosine(37)-N1)-methyltransferase TrmD [Acidobacteriota bacterium]